MYRHAHRPNHRRPAGPEEAPEEAGSEQEGEEEREQEEAAPIEDGGRECTDTELEGSGVHEGPALPPWMGVAAIFDNPQSESESDLEPEASSIGLALTFCRLRRWHRVVRIPKTKTRTQVGDSSMKKIRDTTDVRVVVGCKQTC